MESRGENRRCHGVSKILNVVLPLGWGGLVVGSAINIDREESQVQSETAPAIPDPE